MTTEAKFYVGQIIHHKKYDYRGVITDVDADFQGTDDWYDQVAVSRPPKNKPWYHVLVDNAVHMTYVAEQHLEPDHSKAPITHPAIYSIFDDFSDGAYHMNKRTN
jgi:heat shock protein HspQ